MRKLETLFSFVVATLLGVGCGTASVEPDVPRPPESLGPWTDAFLERGLLIADEITIEGPPALRDHLVLPQDPENATNTTRATDDGLLQLVEAKTTAGAEIRAHLDNWELVATQRLRVLERPVETDVRVIARGLAAFHPLGSTAEGGVRRGAELSFLGELAR